MNSDQTGGMLITAVLCALALGALAWAVTLVAAVRRGTRLMGHGLVTEGQCLEADVVDDGRGGLRLRAVVAFVTWEGREARAIPADPPDDLDVGHRVTVAYEAKHPERVVYTTRAASTSINGAVVPIVVLACALFVLAPVAVGALTALIG